jgi:hypothetical protein
MRAAAKLPAAGQPAPPAAVAEAPAETEATATGPAAATAPISDTFGGPAAESSARPPTAALCKEEGARPRAKAAHDAKKNAELAQKDIELAESIAESSAGRVLGSASLCTWIAFVFCHNKLL